MDYAKAERLAALLDGACDEQERERLLALLADDDEELAVFSAAAAALKQYETEERETGVVPIGPPPSAPAAPPRRWWKPPREFAIAASIAVLLGGALLWRAVRGQDYTPYAIVAELSNPADGIPAGFDMEPWGASRGAVNGSLSTAGQVQLGARLADLQLLAGQNDSAARAAATDIVGLLDQVTTAGELVTYYSSVEREIPRDGLDRDMERRAAEVSGPYTRVGAWIETARVAAFNQDEAFFRSDVSRDVLAGRGPAEGRLSPSDLTALRRGLDEAEASPPEWDLLQTTLDGLLIRLAR